jgi:hypothetical protein
MMFNCDPTVGFTPSAGSSPPAWLASANPAVWEFVELAGTNISALSNSTWTDAGIIGNSGPASIVNTWQGDCCDTRDSTFYVAAPGGDQDYAGNPVISIRLTDDVPVFAQNLGPSAAADVNAGLARNDDDTPNARHTYYSPHFIESLGRLFLMGAAALYNNNAGSKDVAAFDPATGLWLPTGTYPDLVKTPGVDCSMAKDPVSEIVYAWGGRFLYGYDLVAQTSHGILTDPFGDDVAGGFLCVDTRRNQMLYAGGGASNYRISIVNLSTFAIAKSSTGDIAGLSGPNAIDITGTGLGAVFVLAADPADDCYLVRKGGAGGTVYRINAATRYTDTAPTIGGASIPAVVTGPYSRFSATGDLGGGFKGVFLIPHYTSNCWFMRTPSI